MNIYIKDFKPPSLNTIYRTTRGGNMYKTTQYRDLCNTIQARMNVKINEIKEYIPIEKKIYLKMIVSVKGRRDQDIDNMIKWIDIFNKVLWKDDKQIIRLNIYKKLEQESNSVKMMIKTYDENGKIEKKNIIKIEI